MAGECELAGYVHDERPVGGPIRISLPPHAPVHLIATKESEVHAAVARRLDSPALRPAPVPARVRISMYAMR